MWPVPGASAISMQGRTSTRTASSPAASRLRTPAELSRAILARPDQFVQAFTEKLMTYALGRQLNYQDMPTVRAIVRQAAARDYDFGVLVGGIVGSDAFRMRRLPEATVEPKRVAQAGTEK